MYFFLFFAGTFWNKGTICELCDKSAQQYCNCCQVNLSNDCVSKHRNEAKNLSHEIVSFQDRKIQIAFPKCTIHDDKRCEIYCQTCKEPICIKCLCREHQHHEFRELKEVADNIKQEIKHETNNIIEIIHRNQFTFLELKNTIFKSSAKFEGIKKEGEEIRKLLHEEIEQIFEKLDIQERLKCLLQELQSNFDEMILDLTNTVRENQVKIQSIRFSEIMDHMKKKE